MIRNNAEYMLEDGSPRYGIRTTGLVAEGETPAITPAIVGRTAEEAATLDGAELKLAAQHRFVLDRFVNDAATISDLREAHPDELKEAEDTVAARLGSPAVWRVGARKAYARSVAEEADKDGTLPNLFAHTLMAIAIYLGAIVLAIGAASLEIPFTALFLVILGYWFLTAPLQRKIRRQALRKALPVVEPEDARIFWDDVVNATLLSVLRSKGVHVDIATSAALMRGWNHTRYVATVAQELRINPARP